MSAPAKLYVRDGSRYVELSPTLLRDCPPIPEPRRLDEEGLLPGYVDEVNPQRTVLVVARCPHGSFAWWAARNCCRR